MIGPFQAHRIIGQDLPPAFNSILFFECIPFARKEGPCDFAGLNIEVDDPSDLSLRAAYQYNGSIYLATEGGIFSDGFGSGDTSNWSGKQ